MEEVVSMIVANGLWATLFCMLLFYELKDSRKREQRYTDTISALSEKLGIVAEIKTDAEELMLDTEKILFDTEAIRKACVKRKKSGCQAGQ